MEPGATGPTVRLFDSVGQLIAEGPPLEGPDREFGGGVDLVVDPAGVVLRDLRRPGYWLRIEGLGPEPVDGAGPRAGAARGHARSERQVQVGRARASSSGIGLLPDGDIVKTRFEMPFVPTADRRPAPDEIVCRFAVFTSDGGLLGTTKLKNIECGLARVGRESGHVFFRRDEPYPSVVEYRVVVDGGTSTSATRR